MIGLVTLGAVFLAVTGAEALYADLGHFGRKPIQTAWLYLVLPALALNYLGPGRARALRPDGDLKSLLSARAVMGALPDDRACHRGHGDREPGRDHRRLLADQPGGAARPPAPPPDQADVGDAGRPNLHSAHQGLLLVGTMLLVVLFQSSNGLASAYGVAVTGTMLVDGVMAFIVIWRVWKWALWAAIALMVPFIIIDLAFFGSTCSRSAWRLGAAPDRRMPARGHAHLAPRRQDPRRQDAAAGNAARPPPRDFGKKRAASGAGHRRVSHCSARERTDRAVAQPEALQGAA